MPIIQQICFIFIFNPYWIVQQTYFHDKDSLNANPNKKLHIKFTVSNNCNVKCMHCHFSGSSFLVNSIWISILHSSSLIKIKNVFEELFSIQSAMNEMKDWINFHCWSRFLIVKIRLSFRRHFGWIFHSINMKSLNIFRKVHKSKFLIYVSICTAIVVVQYKFLST